MTETTETTENSDGVKPIETEIKTPETENSASNDLPEVKLSPSEKKKLRNKKYYEKHRTEILSKRSETTEIKPKKSEIKTPETEIKTNSSNSASNDGKSYIWVVAVIALIAVCLFALYIFSHGQTTGNGEIVGLPYY